MKVKITHTVDLDAVSDQCNELLKPALKKLSKSLTTLSAASDLLDDSTEAEISLSVLHLELTRRKLAETDTILQECHAMLAGVDEYYTNEREKSLIEQGIAAQEEQLRQEQQINQQQATDTTPPVRKLWDPTSKTTSLIEPEKGE